MSILQAIVILGGAFVGSLLRASQLSGAVGMSLLLPLCFVLRADVALAGLVAIFCGAKLGKGNSAFGGAIFAGIFAAILIPYLSRFGATMTQAEIFALILFVIISMVLVKDKRYFFCSLASLGLGLLIPVIGIDVLTGVQRYSFGIAELQGGIDFVVVAVGVCCIGELLNAATLKISKFKTEESLPHGAESSESARRVGELIPAISLGMPCDAETAILVGMFSLYGIVVPSESFLSVMTIFVSAITAQVLMSNFAVEPMIRVSKKFADFFNPAAIYPLFATIAFCGVYTLNYRIFDMLLLIFFGFLGYAMRRFAFPVAPLLVGVVLGPRFEAAFRSPQFFSFSSLTWLNIILYVLVAATIANTLQRWRKQGKLSKHPG